MKGERVTAYCDRKAREAIYSGRDQQEEDRGMGKKSEGWGDRGNNNDVLV